ncbi:MAG: asparagine synthase (glutamine-hydrolyzing) [Burkholderiaceae bacterium]
MCGISGVVGLGGAPVARDALQRMIDSIRHRGPDASGLHVENDGTVGLAHARLSIIDLACGGQPMAGRGGELQIVFNGEIFNYLELRAELLRKGHRFVTESDTEVILRMYEEHGDDCVRHFNGDWAFAIWDARRRRLFLSRDRVGVRPLFYARTASHFVFASEVKALLRHPGVTPAIDLEALDQVFTFWCPLAPKTMFEGVHELPPGHCMAVEDGRVRSWQYWQVAFPTSFAPIDEEEASARLLELLADATRVRLRSDVPVGAYLSGGLDSSVVTALVRRASGSRLRSFSVTFDQGEFDESGYQDEVVRLLATEHQAVRCTLDDIARVLPDVIWHAEKPLLRTAPAPLFLLSGLVRDAGYKVVLTGEGSDEFLGGYDIFKEARIRRFWARNVQSRFRPLLLRRLYPYLGSLQAQSDAYLRRFFRVDAADLDSPFFSHLPRWEMTAGAKLFLSADVRQQLAGRDAYREAREMLPAGFAAWDEVAQAQYLEATMLLPGYILSSQGDRMAMAHSVEGRFPFLDHRVIEFGCSLPPRLRMRVLDEKYLLKRAAGHLVPPSVAKRPKQPYRAPDAAALFDFESGLPRSAYVDELLSENNVRKTGLFDARAVGKLVDKARRGNVTGARDNMALIGILSMQLLVEQFVTRSGSQEQCRT